MRMRTVVSVVGLMAGAMLAVVLILVSSSAPGEYHAGGSLLCYDCHTMHFSQTHNWDGSTPVATTPTAGGNWLGASGPNSYLLKAPANQLCLACHDGQSFAPDVLGTNINASPNQGRQAGALNDTVGASPYQTWKGHTLDSPAQPPGWSPDAVGAPANWYNWTADHLQCISCHAAHGVATAYRNLGPVALGSAQANAQPTYVINTANDTTKDVWINLASYTAGSGNVTTFNPYYDAAKISFNRNDNTVGTTKTSNRMDTLCGTCHGTFHGGPGDSSIGASAGALNAFLRHPTSQATIGASTFANHSDLARFQANSTKVKVYSNNTDFSNATPGCVSCHKSHGNQNPFGLVFLNRNAASVGEEGGYASGQTNDVPTGYRNLCGQCHGQGN